MLAVSVLVIFKCIYITSILARADNNTRAKKTLSVFSVVKVVSIFMVSILQSYFPSSLTFSAAQPQLEGMVSAILALSVLLTGEYDDGHGQITQSSTLSSNYYFLQWDS